MVELIRGGVIGKVREVHVWTNRPVWPQGMAKPADAAEARRASTGTSGSARPTVDWGYNPDYAHFNWRGWVPFGVGALGDMGAHLIDFPLWALEPGLPTRVETRHSPLGRRHQPVGRPSGRIELTSYPLASVTHYEFGNAKGGPLKLTWYDGGLMPPTPEGHSGRPHGSRAAACMFVGDQGMLHARDLRRRSRSCSARALPRRAAAIPVSLPRIQGGMRGHEMNWIRAIRGEEAISSPFELAVPLNETMILGMVALRAERRSNMTAKTAGSRTSRTPTAS